MRIPDLDRVYASFFNIDEGDNLISIIRGKVKPLIRDLEFKKIIGWFAFHVHPRKQYNPAPPERQNEIGIHLRLELLQGKKECELKNALPCYCENLIRGIEQNISGITVGPNSVAVTSLKGETIAASWKVIGEASEWVLNLLDSYKEETAICNPQIVQHIHFIMNLLQPLYTRLQNGTPITPLNGVNIF